MRETQHATDLSRECCKAGGQVIPFHSIVRVDAICIEQLRISLHLTDGTVVMADGIDALELAMQLKPSILEGRRMRWAKHAWLVHNLLGHPIMQLLAVTGNVKLAMWVHDHTVPRPRGLKTNRQVG